MEVTLREHLEEVIDLRFDAIEKALILAAKEAEDRQEERSRVLEKHLGDLNHAQRNAIADRGDFLTKAQHTSDMKEIDTRLRQLEKIAAIAVFLSVAVPTALSFLLKMR